MKSLRIGYIFDNLEISNSALQYSIASIYQSTNNIRNNFEAVIVSCYLSILKQEWYSEVVSDTKDVSPDQWYYQGDWHRTSATNTWAPITVEILVDY